MNLNLKAMTLGIAALAASVLATAIVPASAQRAASHHVPRGPVAGTYYASPYNPYGAGTGAIPDEMRDPHDDR